jgi:hypothetical protein
VNISVAQQDSMFGETAGPKGDEKKSTLGENEEASPFRLTPKSEHSWFVVTDEPEDKPASSSTQERYTTFEVEKAETNVSMIEDVLASTFISTQEWMQDWKSRRAKLTTFDGPADDFDFLPEQQSDHINNTTICEGSSAPPLFNRSMEVNQGQTRLPATSFSSAMVKPLHVHKALSQSPIARSQQSSNDHNSRRGSSEKPFYPPRSSSICSHKKYRDPAAFQPSTTRANTPSVSLDSEEYSIATNGQRHYPSYSSADAQSTDINTGRSTISSTKSRYLSDTSSAIMGDFVPIDSPNMAGLQPTMEPLKVPLQRSVPRWGVYGFC